MYIFVFQNASLPRIFRLFRGLGLRHIVVVNDVNEVTIYLNKNIFLLASNVMFDVQIYCTVYAGTIYTVEITIDLKVSHAWASLTA